MALLAYLVMIAFLMTSAFIGFEWIATSAPRTVAHHFSPAKSVAVIQKRQAYLAARSLRNSSAYAKDNANNSASVAMAAKIPSDESKEIASIEEPAQSAEQTPPHSGHARHSRPKIAIRRARDAAGQTAYGYGASGFEGNSFFFGQRNGWQGGGTP